MSDPLAEAPAADDRSVERTRAGAPRVVVVGGGVIGLASAWELARRGAHVQVWDPAPGQGASHAAGGMLAPVSEASWEEEDLLDLLLTSHGLWPGFAARLHEASGVDPDVVTTGSLHVGYDLDDAREVWRTATLLERHDLPHARLSSRELRRLAPALAPGARGGLRVDSDLSVDNRAVVRGLLVACERAGVVLVRRSARLLVEDGAVVGVTPSAAEESTPPVAAAAGHLGPETTAAADAAHRTGAAASADAARRAGAADAHEHPWGGAGRDGAGRDGLVRADVVVLAAGSRSPAVPGLGSEVVLPVHPVKGQILRMSGPPGLLDRTVRGTVHGDHVYLIPRSGGELVVGATTDERDDTDVTGRGLLELLRAATTLLPEVGELRLVDAVARLRPGTPDNGPLLGPGGTPGLVVATGHFRHGMLLAPVTAQVVAETVLDGRTTVEAASPFAATRFVPGAPPGDRDEPRTAPHPSPTKEQP